MRRVLFATAAAAAALCVLAAGSGDPDPVVVQPMHSSHHTHLFYLPGGPVCLHDAEQHCTQILQVCRPGHECEIQCSADHVPDLSPECIRTHACAPDVEKHCADHAMSSLLHCLKANAHKLSHRCLEAEPCLTHSEARCPEGKFWVRPATPSIRHLFPFLASPEEHDDRCACAHDFPCGDHLDHEFCQPCGDGCVRNPLCGVGRSWCITASKDCREPGLTAMFPHDCFGPYPRHPSCSSELVHKEAELVHKSHFPKDLRETIERRCKIQHDLAKKGICPKVDVGKAMHKLKSYHGKHRKTCGNAQPSINSFVHHFFDGLFGRHRRNHHSSVDSTLRRQEELIRSERDKLENLQDELQQVKGVVHQQARFSSGRDERSWWWLLVAPLSLAAVGALLYQWKNIRRA